MARIKKVKPEEITPLERYELIDNPEIGMKAYLPQMPRFAGGRKEAGSYADKYGQTPRVAFSKDRPSPDGESTWIPRLDTERKEWYWECVRGELYREKVHTVHGKAMLANPSGHAQLRKRYAPEEFKALFKVGDIIESWTTNKRLRITAIGESRFLGKDWRGHERVCTMSFTQGWTKVEEVTPPEIGW